MKFRAYETRGQRCTGEPTEVHVEGGSTLLGFPAGVPEPLFVCELEPEDAREAALLQALGDGTVFSSWESEARARSAAVESLRRGVAKLGALAASLGVQLDEVSVPLP